MLRVYSVLAGLFLTGSALAETENQPQLPTPKGWKTETIALPPAFAKEMKWKGTEELRFAPGMFKADSDTFFSYALLFWLPADQKIDAKTMEQEFLAYYRGLAKAVTAGKNPKVDVATFTLTIKDAAEKTGKRASGEAYSAFVGELKWNEPFATLKPQTLRLDIHTWTCDKQKHQCIFVCVSPQPEAAEVWKTLREIRAGCKCP